MHEAYNPPSPSRYPDTASDADGSGKAPDRRNRAPAAILFDIDSLADGNWLHEGVREMLTALASAGYPLAILSTTGSRVPALLEAVLASEAFDLVLVGDDVADTPDRSRTLLATGERLEVDSGQIALITGALAGLTSGDAAGMPTGAALWSLADSEARGRFRARLAKHAPEWVFEAPADVTRQFAPWC